MGGDEGSKLLKQNVARTSKTVVDRKKPTDLSPSPVGPMMILFMFSTAMLTLPLGTYYIIRHYIVRSTTMSAMGAIVMIQIIVASYIYKAWKDEKRDREAEQRKDR